LRMWYTSHITQENPMTATATKPVLPILTWGFNSDGGDEAAYEWECLTESLTEVMVEINPSNKWYCEVSNFGWQKRDGHKTFTADIGHMLLSSILPRTDCTFKIYRYGKSLRIQNWHHDSPSGDESYTIRKWKRGDPE
jgi:hypothetical protein